MSVIVPIHNAGVHLRSCLNTLVNQTLTDIEIILVLDCPTDGSDLIAKEYAARDKRIMLVQNDINLFIGLSRNKGLQIARGEYVGFSDHDDFRELTMYEELYNDAKKHESDIVISAYGMMTNDQLQKKLYPEFGKESVREKLLELSIGRYNTEKEWIFFIRNGGMWNKIFKNEFLQKQNILFTDNRTSTYEDLLFLISCFYYSNRVSVVNKVFYYHMEGINNASAKYFYNSYPLVSAFLEQLNDFLHENELNEQYKLFFYNTVINCVLGSVINEFFAPKPFWEKMRAFFYFRRYLYVRVAFRSQKVENIIFPARNTITLFLRHLLFLFYRL